ncbi:ABC transporter permease [Mesorhizobium sp. RP14(2022)]|uniref:ABC transporter permease n=1 Tax=Mesorhizobium liriopis TaxID=2953882 RepID=A0ABT1CAJ6_9HYPH|nr:ABC transporter permease [Mesorhizobium liriopis]MCO6051835.1 ABC transporter permease [Mesorhizobium liriopis]
MGRIVARLGGIGFAALLLLVLLVVNVWLTPGRFQPSGWLLLLGLAAPLIGAAMASTPAILSGRGGIDVSVGPQMGLINAILIKVLVLDFGIAHPLVLVPAALLIGALIGAFNGFLTTVVRIQPIVATLGTYLILSGVTLTILPAPVGPAPVWLKSLAGPLAFLPLGAVALSWWFISRSAWYDQLMAVGSDDRAAFTAGVPVTGVRFFAYLLSGIYAGAAALMLSALIGSADPNVGPTYTLIAISAVALGGVSLAGGRGGLLGAAVGALDIFLLQNALTYFNISTFVLQIAYGSILVAAVVLTALQTRAVAARVQHV